MTTVPASPVPAGSTTYSGTSSNVPMVVITCLAAVLVVVMGASSPEGLGGVALPLGLVVIGIVADVLTATSVRATAGPAGVQIHWGVVGWPRVRAALDQIDRAEVVEVAWWGVSWGWWWWPRATVCTTATGPALRLHLTNGRRITVTVPEPEAALAALEAARR